MGSSPPLRRSEEFHCIRTQYAASAQGRLPLVVVTAKCGSVLGRGRNRGAKLPSASWPAQLQVWLSRSPARQPASSKHTGVGLCFVDAACRADARLSRVAAELGMSPIASLRRDSGPAATLCRTPAFLPGFPAWLASLGPLRSQNPPPMKVTRQAYGNVAALGRTERPQGAMSRACEHRDHCASSLFLSSKWGTPLGDSGVS